MHLDIKPDNILVSQDGSAKLADCGLAKSLSAVGEWEGSYKTMLGIVGTPGIVLSMQSNDCSVLTELSGYIDPLYMQTGQFHTHSDGVCAI